MQILGGKPLFQVTKQQKNGVPSLTSLYSARADRSDFSYSCIWVRLSVAIFFFFFYTVVQMAV